MSRRINIMLPEKTLAVLDRVAPRGNRSQFVSRAVLHYVETLGKQSLREQLKAGYLANADENLRISQIVEEAKAEQVNRPMSTEAMLNESDRLARYGARQARKVGVKPKDVSRIVHEHRKARRRSQ